MKSGIHGAAHHAMPPPLDTLRDRLLAHIQGLSPQQKTIAEFLLDNLREVPFLSVPQLAERSGVSEATVVRLCQSIGYSGFSDLKMALIDTLREEVQGPEPDAPSVPDARSDPLSAVAELERGNILRTVEGIDRAVFERVATRLFQAGHVFTFGLGVSAHLADFAAYLFTEHGLRATAFGTRFSSPREQLVILRPGDLVLAFSFPPYSRQTLEVLEEARDRGIDTIAVCDRPSAPAGVIASDALCVSSHGMMFINATASVDVVLQALVVEIASRHRGETVEALSRINRALRDRNYLVEDDG
jgi:DNA-binding MurR/RpiR family transcriptional regulator